MSLKDEIKFHIAKYVVENERDIDGLKSKPSEVAEHMKYCSIRKVYSVEEEILSYPYANSLGGAQVDSDKTVEVVFDCLCKKFNKKLAVLDDATIGSVINSI